LRAGLAEHHGSEHKDVCIFVLPALGRHACLGAGFFQERLPVPFLLHRNLGQEKPFIDSVLHEQAVFADLDLSNIAHAPQRRQHRDFVVELAQFPRRDRLESRIAQSGKGGRVSHRHVERLHRRGVADTASQFPRFLQGDEGAALLIQRFARTCGRFVRLLFLHRVLHRLAGQSQQFTFFVLAQ